jgi:hypothetical protein
MKKFFKDNDWREALPILYYLLRFYIFYEIIKLVESSDRSIFFKVIISILIVCLEFQWFISQTNKNE